MNDSQKNELNSIKKTFEERSNSLCLKKKYFATGKTETGYKFVRICKQKDCRVYVNLRINVAKGTGTINYGEKCKKIIKITLFLIFNYKL